jgi:hypothetical protein
METTAKRALTVGLIAFGLWALLDASTMLHNAEVSPLGARRSAALAVLKPLARFTDWLSLDRPVEFVDSIRAGHWWHGPRQPATVLAAPPPAATAVLATGGARPASGQTAVAPVATSSAGTATATDAASGDGPLRTPSAADPLRILVVGDSIGSSVGYALAERLDASGLARTVVDGRPDTGLSRPDYFDWNVQLRADLARVNPDVVVVMLGGNDAQSFVDHGRVVTLGTPEWLSAYRARVQAFSALAAAGGRRLAWIGLPVMRSATFSTDARMLDGAYHSVVADLPHGRYVDTWATLANGAGRYADYLPDAQGRLQLVRQPDGVHLAAGGTARVSAALIAAMRAAWVFTAGA